MNFIMRETQPMTLTINGVTYPAIWNFNAIAKMEEYTELMHLFTLGRIKDGRFCLVKEFIGAVYGMLTAAGVTCVIDGKDVLADAIVQSIRPDEEEAIYKQVMAIISAQGDQPAEGEPKNASKPQRKTLKASGTTA